MSTRTESNMIKDEALKIENSDFNKCTKQELFEYIIVLREALEQPAQEPVGKVYNGNAYWAGKAPDNATPLYTHPTQPLSDDVIEDIGYNFADLGGDIADWSGFARAIEKAHNIGERNGI